MANDLVLNPTAIVNKMIALRVKPGVLKSDSPKPITDIRIDASNLSKEVNKFRACDGYACFYCREWTQLVHKKHFSAGNKTRKKVVDTSVTTVPREKVKDFIHQFEQTLHSRLENEKDSESILLYIFDTVSKFLGQKSGTALALDAIFAPITHDASPEAIAFSKDPEDPSQLIPQVENEKSQLTIPASEVPLLRKITPKILANHDSPTCAHSPTKDNTPSDLETFQKMINSAIAKEAKTSGLAMSQALSSVWEGTCAFLEEIKKIESIRSDVAGEGCFHKVALFNQQHQEILQSFNDYWSPVAEAHKKTKGKKSDKSPVTTADEIDETFFKFLENIRSSSELWNEEFLQPQIQLCQQLLRDLFQASSSVVDLARAHYVNNGSGNFQVELENKSEKVLLLLQELNKQMKTKLSQLEAEFAVKVNEIHGELDSIKDAWLNESQSTLHGRLEKAANKDFKKKIKKVEALGQAARIWCVSQLKTFLSSRELSQILVPCLGVQMLHAEDIEPAKLKELIEQNQELVDSIRARKQDIKEQFEAGVNTGRSTLGAILGKLFLREGLRLIEERVSVHKERMLLGVYNDVDSVDSSDLDTETKSKTNKKKNKKKKKNATGNTSVASSTASSPVEEKSMKLPEANKPTNVATKPQNKPPVSQEPQDKPTKPQATPVNSTSETKAEDLNESSSEVSDSREQHQVKLSKPLPSPVPKVPTTQAQSKHEKSRGSEPSVPSPTPKAPSKQPQPKSDKPHALEPNGPSKAPATQPQPQPQPQPQLKIEKPRDLEPSVPSPVPKNSVTQQQSKADKPRAPESYVPPPKLKAASTQPPPGLSFARAASQHLPAEKVAVRAKSSEEKAPTVSNQPDNKSNPDTAATKKANVSMENPLKPTAAPNRAPKPAKNPVPQDKPLSFADTVCLPPSGIEDKAQKSTKPSPPATSPIPQTSTGPNVTAPKLNPPPGIPKSNPAQPQHQPKKEYTPKPSDTAATWRRVDTPPNEIRSQVNNVHPGPAPGMVPVPNAYGIATPPESVAGTVRAASTMEAPTAAISNNVIPVPSPISSSIPNVPSNAAMHPPGIVEPDLQKMGHDDMLKFVQTLLTEKSELVSLLMNMQQEVYSLTVKCTDMVEYVRRQDMMYHVKEQDYKQALMMKEMEMEKARRYVYAMEQRIALLERTTSNGSVTGNNSRPVTPSLVQDSQSPKVAPRAATPTSRTSSTKAETRDSEA